MMGRPSCPHLALVFLSHKRQCWTGWSFAESPFISDAARPLNSAYFRHSQKVLSSYHKCLILICMLYRFIFENQKSIVLKLYLCIL